MLSFPKWINESIIIIDNCKPTTPTDRSYFCEPNKFCFTIFGHLHNLLYFFKDQLKTKLNNPLLIHWKKENRIQPAQPVSERRGPLPRIVCAHARSTDTAHVGVAQPCADDPR